MRLWRLVLPDGQNPTTTDTALSIVWIVAVLALFAVGWRQRSDVAACPRTGR
jgi:hypothetical protein